MCSLHILATLCSKSFKLGFSSTWTENFQMYKLNLEKAEEPEIKLPTFIGSWRKQESSRKTSTSASLTYAEVFDYVDPNKLWKILRDGKTRPPYLSPEKPVSGQEATVRTKLGTTDWFKLGRGV